MSLHSNTYSYVYKLWESISWQHRMKMCESKLQDIFIRVVQASYYFELFFFLCADVNGNQKFIFFSKEGLN